MSIAVYILNHNPSKRLKSNTHEEAWTNDRPRVHHFQIFGSLAYRFMLDERRKKLDNKSEALILIGYHLTGASDFIVLQLILWW